MLWKFFLLQVILLHSILEANAICHTAKIINTKAKECIRANPRQAFNCGLGKLILFKFFNMMDCRFFIETIEKSVKILNFMIDLNSIKFCI